MKSLLCQRFAKYAILRTIFLGGMGIALLLFPQFLFGNMFYASGAIFVFLFGFGIGGLTGLIYVSGVATLISCVYVLVFSIIYLKTNTVKGLGKTL